MNSRGIVTSVSTNLWESYLLFHASLMRHNDYELVVVDLGLPLCMAEFIKQQVNTRLVKPQFGLLGTIDDDWRKWYKPFFFKEGIDAAGFKQALWLDIDTIIAGPLTSLFDKIDECFFAVPDYFAPEYCPNNLELYDVLMLQRPVDKRVINSGVVGADIWRDANIIEQWLDNVKMAHANPAIKELITLHDQGTLLLAIHQCGNPLNIVENQQWNFPARRIFYGNDRDLIDSVVSDHPDALIIHYMGWPKLPQLMKVNHDDMIVASRQKFGPFETTNIIVSGFDNLLQPTAAALRQQVIYGGWCHYDNNLAIVEQLAELYYGGTPDQMLPLRTDWPFSYTMNPYFGPLFASMKSQALHWVLIGDPVEHMIAKLLSFQIWPQFLHLFPDHYQHDYLAIADRALAFRNHYRLAHGNTLVDLCLHELTWILSRSLATGKAVFVSSISDAVDKLAVIGPWRMFTTNKTTVAHTNLPHSKRTAEWVTDFVESFREQLISTFFKILYTHKAKIPLTIL